MAAISENILIGGKSKKKQKSKKKGKKTQSLHTPGGGALIVYVNPGNRIVPDVYATKLTYAQRVILTSTAGAFTTTQFSGNSVYDPYIPTGGSVPEGYTIMSSLYVNFRVVKFWLEAVYATVGTTASTQMMEICVSLEPTATSPSTMEAMKGSPYHSWKIVSGTTNPLNKIKMSMSVAKIFGIEPTGILTDSRYSGTTGSFGSGANPSNNCVINIGLQGVDRSSSVTSQVYVTIVYDVEFYNRQTFTTMG